MTNNIIQDTEKNAAEHSAAVFEQRFHRALENREFVIWAQPKYNAFNGRITSAEALVRWMDTDGNIISPGEFIPQLEQNGLITELDEYVFRTVCTLQRELLNGETEPVPISVNLSRVSLFDKNVCEIYSRITDEIGVPKELVPIELTESATIENIQINSLVAKLKHSGFYLHLDDFGYGYSSLSSLNTLKMDALKLDKSLVDGIGNKGGDEIIRHIIELAHFFQMEVIAEGVETDNQYHFLQKLSCDTIQGYLFSKPLPFADFLKACASQPKERAEMMEGAALADAASVGSLRITNDTKMQYLSALARIYMTMHVIDLKEDTVVEFATTTNVKEHCNRVHDCVGQMRAAMTATVAPDYVDAVLRFTDLTTIAKRMRGKKTLSAEFVGKHFGWFCARFITITVNENEEPEKLIYTTQVIETDKKREDTLLRACRTDELTGVSNLTGFEEDIETMEIRPDLAVISIDINGLRKSNETFGYSAGDELIWGTADCMNSVFGKNSRIYRIGGDHFLAFFYAEPAQIGEIAEKYSTVVHDWIGNRIGSLSTSFGIAAHAEFPDKSPKELVAEADRRRLEYKASLKAGKEAADET